jgi:hypothetical protein
VVILILEELRFAPIRYWNNLAASNNMEKVLELVGSYKADQAVGE